MEIIKRVTKGSPLTHAELDGNFDYLSTNKADLVGGKVPSSQLPVYVDEVIDGYLNGGVFYNEVGFTTAITGLSGKIYIDVTAGQSSKGYRWSGSAYIAITNGFIASTDDVSEGTTNRYFTAARVLTSILTGVGFTDATAITATDTILQAFGKVQGQISGLGTKIGGALSTLNTTDKTNLIAAINEVNAKPSGGAGTNLGWFHVEAYGAVHNGVTDDTDSIQAAINACNAAGGGTIYFPKGIYVIAGAAQSPSGAQLVIPHNAHADSATNTHIKLLGEIAPNFFSNPLSGGLPPNTGVIFKSTFGSAVNIISSASVYTNYLGFNFSHLEIENITIRVKSKSGATNIAPMATGIYAYNLAYLTLLNVRVDTESENSLTVLPAVTAKGIVCPFTDNFVFVHLDKVLVYGFYTGIELYESASLADVFVDCCYNGIELKGSTHATYVSRSFISRCRTSVRVSGTASFYINAGLEANKTDNTWNKNVYDLEETIIGSLGTLIYNRVEAYIGVNNTNFTRAAVAGISKIKAFSINQMEAFPTVATGEKILSITSAGPQKTYEVVDQLIGSTSVATLDAANWSTGSISATGNAGEKRYGADYEYSCTGTDVWRRTHINLVVNDYSLGDVDDSGGIKTSAQMIVLFPAAISPQIAFGVNGIYRYAGVKGWFYSANSITI